MTNLRDRIADFLQAHQYESAYCGCGLPVEDQAHHDLHVADAVIEALALKREHLSGRDSLYAIAGDPRPIHRYVTEWTADD